MVRCGMWSCYFRACHEDARRISRRRAYIRALLLFQHSFANRGEERRKIDWCTGSDDIAIFDHRLIDKGAARAGDIFCH
jgi:hypothetical protein